MLRGIASFGPANVALTDRSLSLSEDAPVSISTVDTPERITALTDEVSAMTGRGVITLTRGHLVTSATPEYTGAVRLSLYLGRRQRVGGTPAYAAACDVLHRLGFAGAEVLLGVDGTVSGQRRRARFFSRNTDVPLVVAGVGTAAQAAAAVDELRGILVAPLITIEPTVVCKRLGKMVVDPRESLGAEPFQKLTVRTAEDARHGRQPIHRALIERLKDSEHASGATVLRGIWGFHRDERPHGDHFLQLTRHVPVSTVIIDTAPNIAASFAIVDEVTDQEGLVTCEALPAMLAVHDGQSVGSLALG
jgi:PII-like signaling protein